MNRYIPQSPSMYADACAAAGVGPPPDEDLAVIANALLTGNLPAFATLHRSAAHATL